jgi:hypothetical protein
VTSDEFEREHDAPLSPDERMWRHPAEHADAERNKHLSIIPPLGRRLAALTATVCVVVSISVLVIAVPKGISEYAESEAEIITTTVPILPSKGSTKPLIAVAEGSKGPTTAVSLGHDCWVVAADAVDISEPIWLTLETGEIVQVQYLSKSEDGSAALLHLTTNFPQEIPEDWESYLVPKSATELRSYSMLDIHGVHHLTDEESVQLRGDQSALPLTVDTPIKGAAAILDEKESVVGVAVVSDHGTWFLRKESLHSMLKSQLVAAP